MTTAHEHLESLMTTVITTNAVVASGDHSNAAINGNLLALGRYDAAGGIPHKTGWPSLLSHLPARGLYASPKQRSKLRVVASMLAGNQAIVEQALDRFPLKTLIYISQYHPSIQTALFAQEVDPDCVLNPSACTKRKLWQLAVRHAESLHVSLRKKNFDWGKLQRLQSNQAKSSDNLRGILNQTN